MNGLFTIGYEGAELADFIATLARAGVTTLLDVRELPLSRKKGFSKRALAEALSVSGIAYRHERDLGSPKTIRQRLHSDGDYEQFFESFSTYLRQQRPLLKELAGALDGKVALMCFERDPATCHRSVVARQLELLTGLKTKHLGVTHGASHHRARTGSGEGVPAA
ncbi:MAG: DUF488 domain-containing protein [Rubrivivax sp.]|nr:DUF488 domain-containing protein [Rubrivivax sp.]